MAATMYTPPDRPIQKHLFWLVCGKPFFISNEASATYDTVIARLLMLAKQLP